MSPLTKRIALVGLSLLLITLTGSQSGRAQASEPTAIVDSVLKDLTNKLGKPVTRRTATNFSWEQIDFPDGSLGCPRPGLNYAQVITRGWKILVTVDGVTYDYRATDNGERVFQCSPGGAGTMIPTLTGTPATVTPIPSARVVPIAHQPTTYTNPVAYVGSDGNVYITDLAKASTAPLTNDAQGDGQNFYYPYYSQNHIYRNLRWSPDGTKLAYVDLLTQTLYVVVSGQKPLAVATGLAVEYTPAWSADGGQLLYAVMTQQGSAPNGTIYQVQAVPVSGGQPIVAGQFSARTGCGGGGLDSQVLAYDSEAVNFGLRLVIAPIGGNMLYSATCIGIGVGLAALNGQAIWQRDDLAQPVLSADRTQLATLKYTTRPPSLSGQGIEIVNLTNGQGAVVPTQANVTQLAWSPDSQTIVYSTMTRVRDVTISGTNPLIGQFFPSAPYTSPVNKVSLWKMSVAGGPSTLLFSREGFGIGSIAVSRDGASVVFTFVDSLVNMAQQIAANAGAADVLAAAPRPQILSVSINGGIPSPFIPGSNPALGLLSFIAVPAELNAPVLSGSSQATLVPTSGPPDGSVPPPALVIGQTAVVTATKSNLNMRDAPGTSGRIKRLLTPGTIVTILAGPQLVGGFRWWQVRAPDNSTGWVVDQVTDADGTTNTLTPQ